MVPSTAVVGTGPIQVTFAKKRVQMFNWFKTVRMPTSLRDYGSEALS